MKYLIIALQDGIGLDQAKEIAGMGKDSDVTTIGVMGILCIILLGFTIAIWRSKIAKEKEQQDLNNSTLEALTTANVIITKMDSEIKSHGERINQLSLLINGLIGKLEK